MTHNLGTDHVRMTRREMWRAWARALGREDPERSLMIPMMRDIMKKCRMFRVPDGFYTDASQNAMADEFSHEVFEWLAKMNDTFVLPFPVVAFRGPNQSIIWLTKMYGSRGGQFLGSELVPGFDGIWMSVSMRSLPGGDEAVLRDGGVRLTSVIIAASLDFGPPNDNGPRPMGTSVTGSMALDTTGRVRMLCENSKVSDEFKELRINPSEDYPGGLFTESTLMDELIVTAENLSSLVVQFFVIVQIPRNFIVEIEADAKSPQKKKHKGKKAKRGTDIQALSTKPVYISMAPKEIRKYVGAEEPEAGSSRMRAPHERRAHMRLLTSERFTWKRGEVVPVKATWVGPTRGTTNEGREYRVRLDIASPHTEGGAE